MSLGPGKQERFPRGPARSAARRLIKWRGQ